MPKLTLTSHPRMRWVAWALLAGCTVGHGNGAVVGAIEVAGCDGDADFRDDDYDMNADFFVGQPVLGPDQGGDDDDSLWIVVQKDGAYQEVADALFIQVTDIGAMGEGTQNVTTQGCQSSGGAKPGCVRAELAMRLSCPDTLENLVAAADVDADGIPVTCPENVDLDDAFAGDLDDPDFFDTKDPFFDGDSDAPHPSCIAFRSLSTEWGDEIAAVFHFALRDARTLDGEGRARSYLRGRFRFKLHRGSGAQAFP